MKEISIGEFARRSRLSVKALRLYDKRGVLVPSRVDQASGYRYYDTAQLDDARLVVMMRQLQFRSRRSRSASRAIRPTRRRASPSTRATSKRHTTRDASSPTTW